MVYNFAFNTPDHYHKNFPLGIYGACGAYGVDGVQIFDVARIATGMEMTAGDR